MLSNIRRDEGIKDHCKKVLSSQRDHAVPLPIHHPRDPPYLDFLHRFRP